MLFKNYFQFQFESLSVPKVKSFDHSFDILE